MKRRVFICCSDPYPFGTANSNYIRNFSKCLFAAGFEVTVVGIGENRAIDKCKTGYSYKGISYSNINIQLSGLCNFLKAELVAGKYMNKVLNNYQINHEDYICVYSSLFSVINLALRLVPANHIFSIEVEWLQPFQYKKGRLDPMYLIWHASFRYRTKKYCNFFPISTTLQKYLSDNNKSSCVIPIMIDQSEVDIREISVRKDDHINLIYSGAATNKDSFPCMIKALCMLNDDELEKIRLHFTSLTKEKLIECVQISSDKMERISLSLVFHGWLEYCELLELYKEMDGILLAREKNLATLSNFPSKIPELMSYSVVPICSAVGDYTDNYLTDGLDSIQFEEDNSVSCVAAIRKILTMDDESLTQMKMNARKCVETKFDYHNWVSIVSEYILGWKEQ